jgi:serine/threonine-protein kinase
MSADATLLSAALEGRYRIDRELGAGGMATVYLYFVMPVMRGQTLRDRLRQEHTLPVGEAVRIASEVAGALDYAHRHDVVHRDIKPENILLHEGHAVVADFGIGKALAAASDPEAASAPTSVFTQVGVTVGTPAYMSPEQASGEIVDGRSDLFALGCVLYEMLTGDVAFAGPSPSATIARRFVHSPPPVSDSRPGVPAAVASAVARLLARPADERFPSGAHVVAALRSSETPPAGRPPAPTAVEPVRDQRPPSIAVIPFANLSPDPENEYFSDGLTEELITDLSGVKALRVISRASSRQLKGTAKGLRDAGARPGHALHGAARGAARRHRGAEGGGPHASRRPGRHLVRCPYHLSPCRVVRGGRRDRGRAPAARPRRGARLPPA